MIKLNYKDHDYNILEQKPNDQFHKIRFESSKTPKYAKPENPSMHEKMHVKQKINEKEGVHWTYRLRERDSLQEKWRKMTKNLSGALPSRRERKKLEKVLRKLFEQVKSEFLRNLIHKF